ncbi:MAG: glutamate-5-semialdehyde dehydrogenase [Candidatus Melainabacteria bacterium]|nr:glutamate-5-semialdehyde dehydrogenase [Candidatus Melainabacteria bacterium]
MTTTAEPPLSEILLAAKKASTVLTSMSAADRQAVIEKMATNIERRSTEILSANKHDLKRAEKMLEDGEISRTMLDRLKLDEHKLSGMVTGIRQVASLPDPVGSITLARELDDGLILYQVSAPIGVIAVIFESRPDVLPQIASLALRSANVAVLKGGKEARYTLTVLFECLQEALTGKGLPSQTLILLENREQIDAILKADGLVDLIIPRGSAELVRYIQDHTRIPVLGHSEGVCHLYIHEDANLEMAVALAVDAKVQYPAACNSVETILVHATAAGEMLPLIAKQLFEQNVQIRADNRAFDLISTAPEMPEELHGQLELRESSEGDSESGSTDDSNLVAANSGSSETSSKSILIRANNEDWTTEYSDLIVSVKVVDSLDEAIDHINQYGSNHTDTIVTADADVFEKFFKGVNSAGVFWNASNRFADGFRYGFGAEVGISTNKLHPRGPVGLNGLVTYKYKLIGKGHVVADYVGESAKTFTHRDII